MVSMTNARCSGASCGGGNGRCSGSGSSSGSSSGTWCTGDLLTSTTCSQTGGPIASAPRGGAATHGGTDVSPLECDTCGRLAPQPIVASARYHLSAIVGVNGERAAGSTRIVRARGLGYYILEFIGSKYTIFYISRILDLVYSS